MFFVLNTVETQTDREEGRKCVCVDRASELQKVFRLARSLALTLALGHNFYID